MCLTAFLYHIFVQFVIFVDSAPCQEQKPVVVSIVLYLFGTAQEGLPVAGEEAVDLGNLVYSGADGGNENCIPGKARIEGRHSVNLQGALGLLQGEAGAQAELEDRVPLAGMFFPGDQLIAVTL